jgi:hypothetical protein
MSVIVGVGCCTSLLYTFVTDLALSADEDVGVQAHWGVGVSPEPPCPDVGPWSLGRS